MGTVGHEVSIGMLGSGLLRIHSEGHEKVVGCNVHKGLIRIMSRLRKGKVDSEGVP